jgi:type IV conjugative transfer system coupling protein TraD
MILNPLDTRSKSWHPWIDCHLDSHYDVLAESFIQTKAGVRDPFWDNASRAVLKTALRKYSAQGNTDVQKMITFLMSASDKDFEDFFKDTEAATFTFKNNEKTTNSIRSVLSSQIEGLRQLEATSQPFSLRNWVQNEKKNGWLFITARADQRQTLTPLISAWMDITINALMILSENQQRRLWFVIDELAALQKLPRLQAGLAEGRKYGGCLLVGFQSKPQLEEIYGRHGTEAMLDLFNTKVFFRCTEPSTQAWISKVLGDKEEAEPQENISYGAHSMRDGVSLSRHTRQKPLVMPGEFSQLKDLECYVKLPGDYPCTKLQTKYQKPPALRQEPFLLKPEKARTYGTLPNSVSDVASVSTSTSTAISPSGEIPCI